MTVDTYRDYIGKLALLPIAGIQVTVSIRDVKSAYGNIRAQIVPVAGEGSSWIAFERLVLIDGRIER